MKAKYVVVLCVFVFLGGLFINFAVRNIFAVLTTTVHSVSKIVASESTCVVPPNYQTLVQFEDEGKKYGINLTNVQDPYGNWIIMAQVGSEIRWTEKIYFSPKEDFKNPITYYDKIKVSLNPVDETLTIHYPHQDNVCESQSINQ